MILLGETLHFGQARDFAFDVLSEHFRANSEAGEQRRHNAVGLLDQSGEKMDRFDGLIFVARGDVPRRLQRLLGFHRHFVKTQHDSSLPGLAEEKGLARMPAPMLSHDDFAV